MLFCNLFQKQVFLRQLTHNMTKDCSWNYHEKYNRRTWVEHGLPMLCAWSFHGNSIVVILRVNWCRKESFWQRFTCTELICKTERFKDLRVHWPFGIWVSTIDIKSVLLPFARSVPGVWPINLFGISFPNFYLTEIEFIPSWQNWSIW